MKVKTFCGYSVSQVTELLGSRKSKAFLVIGSRAFIQCKGSDSGLCFGFDTPLGEITSSISDFILQVILVSPGSITDPRMVTVRGLKHISEFMTLPRGEKTLGLSEFDQAAGAIDNLTRMEEDFQMIGTVELFWDGRSISPGSTYNVIELSAGDKYVIDDMKRTVIHEWEKKVPATGPFRF